MMRVSLVSVALVLGLAAVCAAEGAIPWSSLYGMSAKVQLEVIDPHTGKPIEIGQMLQYEGQGQGLSTIDSLNGVFYIIGTNLTSNAVKLVGVSTTTGTLISETALPFATTAFIGVGQYVDFNPNTGEVICYGQDPAVGGQHVIVSANPSTGKVRTIAKIHDTDPIDLLGGTSVYDAGADIVWYMSVVNVSNNIAIRFDAYDATTGAQVWEIADQDALSTMTYDPLTMNIYGLGAIQVGNSIKRTVVTLNSNTATFTQICEVDNYADMLSGITTIDVASRHLYFFGHYNNNTVTTTPAPAAGDASADEVDAEPEAVAKARAALPGQYFIDGPLRSPSLPSMSLVSLSMKTCLVGTAPEACAEFPNCPWNLQMANI